MLEYRSVTCLWLGQGLTQEIAWLRIDGQEQPDWKKKRWIDFLNQSSREGWELITLTTTGQYNVGILAHFKRVI